MQRSTFKVLFYVKRQSEKSGQVPVMGRITINGTMSQFIIQSLAQQQEIVRPRQKCNAALHFFLTSSLFQNMFVSA